MIEVLLSGCLQYYFDNVSHLLFLSFLVIIVLIILVF